MCGIWFSLNIKNDETGIQAGAHRGPDNQGISRFDCPAGDVTLGHRRLSIYDLSEEANQPFSDESGRYTIIFNGAIYNFRAIKSKLEAAGHVFHTQSDTEVLLASWIKDGAACLNYMDGMFAFVIWDDKEKSLFIARDRFGEKPLFMWMDAGSGAERQLIIASDLRQFTQTIKDKLSVNRSVMADYLNFAHLNRSVQSFYQEISSFPPAHHGTINFRNLEAIKPIRYWRAPSPDTAMDREDAAKGIRAALDHSVAERMVADVPVGGCLSGGLDSSAIMTIASLQSKDQRLQSLTAMYDNEPDAPRNISERPYLEAALANADFASTVISPNGADMAAHMDDVITAQGEPFPHSSICAQWFIFKTTKQLGLKVMLDGQGADELLAGYSPLVHHALADKLHHPLKTLGDIKELTTTEGEHSRKSLAAGLYRSVLSEQSRRNLGKIRGTFPPKNLPVAEHLPAAAQRPRGQTRLAAALHDLCFSSSLPALLRFEDRNSMAHGIESRLPFLGKDVAEFAFKIPSALKINDGWTKNPLREAYADVLPKKIVWRRRKLGFETPHQKWLQAELGEWVRYVLLGPDGDRLSGLVNEKWLGRLRGTDGLKVVTEELFRAAVAARWLALNDLSLS